MLDPITKSRPFALFNVRFEMFQYLHNTHPIFISDRMVHMSQPGEGEDMDRDPPLQQNSR